MQKFLNKSFDSNISRACNGALKKRQHTDINDNMSTKIFLK